MHKLIFRCMQALRRIRRWFAEDLWKIRARDLPHPYRIPFKILKIFLLAGRAFLKDQDSVRAAALTLYTLLSIVPVTALLFGIAKGFGLDARLEDWLLRYFADQEDVVRPLIEMAHNALGTTQGGVVAGAGVVFLLYTVVKVIGNVELAFNQIWSVARQRSWGRKFTDYLSIFLVAPFLVLGASSLNVYVATLLYQAVESSPLGRVAAPAVTLGLRAAPLLMLWALFTFLYLFIPNTKVRIPSALSGGLIAAVAYQLVQTFYIVIQVSVSKSNAIYGSFAALPLFLIWLQISWRIVLFGAELTHQHQNFESNEREEHIPDLSFRATKRLSLRICEDVCRRFLNGEAPPTSELLANRLDIPSNILAPLMEKLLAARILVEVVPADGEFPGYHPALDPHRLTPATIVEALENAGEDLADAPAPSTDGFAGLLQEFDRCLENHPINRPLGSYRQESWATRH